MSPQPDRKLYSPDPEVQQALGNVSPELAWLWLVGKVQDAEEEHYEQSEKLVAEYGGLPGDWKDASGVLLSLLNWDPVYGLNQLMHINANFDLQNILKLPPLEVLNAVLRIQISDRYQVGESVYQEWLRRG